MKAYELPIAGAWVFEPTVFPDARGIFAAPFQAAAFREALGFDLVVAQTNHSVSARGVIRGVHFADTPPGQAKYVYCARGALLDVVVDVRVGSPTFGAFEAVELDGRSCRAVYLSEGLPVLDAVQPRSGARGVAAGPGTAAAMAGGPRAGAVGEGRDGFVAHGGCGGRPAPRLRRVRRVVPAATNLIDGEGPSSPREQDHRQDRHRLLLNRFGFRFVSPRLPGRTSGLGWWPPTVPEAVKPPPAGARVTNAAQPGSTDANSV